MNDPTATKRARRTRRRHPAGEVRLLPPTYHLMTPEQEERAVEALAGLLTEDDQARARQSHTRPAP